MFSETSLGYILPEASYLAFRSLSILELQTTNNITFL